MGETKETILLEVKLDDNNSIQKSIELTDAIELLKKQVASTKDEILKYEKAQQTNTVEYKNAQSELIKYNANLKATQSSLATYTNTLVQSQKATLAETGSLNEKRATLNRLNAEYANLANPTQELTNKIKSLSDELKKQESALGNDTRSVGSYKQAIREATQEAQTLERTFGANAESTIDAKKSLANLTDEYQRFNKTTQQFNPEHKFDAIANSTQNITGTLSNATAGLGLFGDASTQVAAGLGSFSSGVGIIATIPSIVKEAKLGFAGLAIAEDAALGPLGLIAIAVTGLTLAFEYFSNNTTTLTKYNLDVQTKLVDARYQHEIDLARAGGLQTQELESEQLKQRIINAKAEFDRIASDRGEKSKLNTALNAEEKAAQSEQIKIIFEAYNKLDILKASSAKEDVKRIIENEKVAIAASEQGYQLRKSASDKIIAERKTALNALTTLEIKHADEITKSLAESDAEKIEQEKLVAIDEVNRAFEKTDKLEVAQKIHDQALLNIDIEYAAKSKTQADKDNAEALAGQATYFATVEALKKAHEDTLIQDLQNKSAGTNNLDEQTNSQLAALKIQQQQEIDAAEKTGGDIFAINQKYEKKIQDLKTQSENNKLSIIKSGLSQAAVAFKKHTTAYKAIAVSVGYIDTYQGAIAAYKAMAGIPVVGPVLGIAAAAGVTVAGLANIANILKQDTDAGFYSGGYTGSGDPRQTSTGVGNKPYTYHMDEYVVPHQLVNHPYVYALEAMRTNNSLGYLGGYASGGFTLPDPQDGRSVAGIASSVASQVVYNEQAMANALIQAYQFMPAPRVAIDEINLGQSNVQIRESRAVS